MPHALKLQLAPYEVPSCHPLPEHTHTANSLDYRVDKNTGEIYGQYIRSKSKPTLTVVKVDTHRPLAPTVTRRDLTCPAYANPVVSSTCRDTAINDSQNDTASTSTGARRGPKPKVRPNPLADIIRQAVKERTHWIENAVMAGVYIAVEGSNGRLNIRPSYLRHVITMPVISTERLALNSVFRNHDFKSVSERYVRYLASAGRVAVGHIERYLEQHPHELQRIQDHLALEDTWSDDCDLDETEYSAEPI